MLIHISLTECLHGQGPDPGPGPGAAGFVGSDQATPGPGRSPCKHFVSYILMYINVLYIKYFIYNHILFVYLYSIQCFSHGFVFCT